VFIGAEPHSEWLHGRIALDDGGYMFAGNDAAGGHNHQTRLAQTYVSSK
jgi:hypothetical protein